MVSLQDSAEFLFWAPALVDLMLLAGTYSAFYANGPEWFLEIVPEPARRIKRTELGTQAREAVAEVWAVLMIAYSAYGVLLPLCVGWAGLVDPALRAPFCAAMSVLMGCKVALFWRLGDTTSPEARTKLRSLYYFDLPCYGGYVLWSAINLYLTN